ncbi:MAG: hypothetical protein K1X33_06755 [Methanobacteriaceae archaeon]|nr:hypothetical protein [Methanobacteriaceae archaeon]
MLVVNCCVLVLSVFIVMLLSVVELSVIVVLSTADTELIVKNMHMSIPMRIILFSFLIISPPALRLLKTIIFI